jgi:hypothetical protein
MADDDGPEVGAVVMDTKRGELGRVMEVGTRKVALRPVTGGVEWWADREFIRPATTGETLLPRLREVNTASREHGGRW